jgi:enoyl-CoA hydratase/carnithine racemase
LHRRSGGYELHALGLVQEVPSRRDDLLSEAAALAQHCRFFTYCAHPDQPKMDLGSLRVDDPDARAFAFIVDGAERNLGRAVAFNAVETK